MVLDAKKKKEKLTHFDVTWKCLKIISVFFFLLLVGALIFELLLWIVFECRNK